MKKRIISIITALSLMLSIMLSTTAGTVQVFAAGAYDGDYAAQYAVDNAARLYSNGQLCAEFVRSCMRMGMQGSDLSIPDRVSATAKYGAAATTHVWALMQALLDTGAFSAYELTYSKSKVNVNTSINGNKIAIGDAIVFNGTSNLVQEINGRRTVMDQPPHIAIVTGIESNGNVLITDTNFCKTVRINNQYSWNGQVWHDMNYNNGTFSLANNKAHVFVVHYEGGGSIVTQPTISFSNTHLEWVTDTTAKIYTDISANVRDTSYVGCRWGTTESLGEELSWSTATYSGLTKCDVTFDGSEGPGLNPGTTYYYQFFVVDKNGDYHFAEMQSFKTTGGDEEPPVFGDVWVTDISPSGYTISCTVTDNKGVNRVQFPSWTLYNDQDDIVDEWWTNPKATGTQNGNTWTFRVNTSDHNNESGIYHTHIYAYDDAGNKSVKEQNYIDVPAILYFDSNGGESKENSTWMYYGKENNNNVSWNTITRDGYTFLGWYTSLTDGAQIYDADGQCTNEGIYFLNNCWNTTIHDLTIYAHWQEIENPDPEKPDPENPDPENPDPENPDPENPDPENPDPENPDPENPDPENPDPENPDPEDPDPVNPDPVNPDPEKPDAPNEKPEEQPAQSSGGGDGAALLIVGAAAVGVAAVVYYHRDALPIWQLNGIVKLEDGTPVAGATVALMQGENVIKTLTTNSNGVYMARVAKGDYQAVVTWSQDGVQYTKQAWVTTETAGGDAGMQEIILDRQA